MPLFTFPTAVSSFQSSPIPTSPVDAWYRSAEADYRLCRRFADEFGARLVRSCFSPRVGWERDGHGVYGILLPDPLPSPSDDWYIYYVWGETLFRRTPQDREKSRMLILPQSADDWVELLRQSLHETVFEVGYEIKPHFLNALGDAEMAASGCEFTLSSCVPENASAPPFQIGATAETPEEAARKACRCWLESR